MVIVILVPTPGLSNVKTGLASKTILSFDITPERTGVPEVVASVVPSYSLLSTTILQSLLVKTLIMTLILLVVILSLLMIFFKTIELKY